MGIPGFGSRWSRTELAAGDNPVHPRAHVTQVGLIAAAQLRGHKTGVPDVHECLAHGLPIDASLAEVYPLAAGSEAGTSLEVLDVNLSNPLADGQYPVFRPPEPNDVTDVE